MAARVSDAKGCAGNFYVIGHTPTRSRVRRAAAATATQSLKRKHEAKLEQVRDGAEQDLKRAR